MKEYLTSVEDVLKEQNSSPDGLTSGDAAGPAGKFGLNKLKEGKKTSLVKRFLEELADPMIIILIVAAVISGITAFYEGNPSPTLSLSCLWLSSTPCWAWSGEPRRKPPSRPCRKSPPLPARSCGTAKSVHLKERRPGARRRGGAGSGRLGSRRRPDHRVRQHEDRGGRPHRRVRSGQENRQRDEPAKARTTFRSATARTCSTWVPPLCTAVVPPSSSAPA